jgi:hypothetical protein
VNYPPDLLPLAVRAYALPTTSPITRERRKQRVPRRPGAGKTEPARRPGSILLIDVETTVDSSQALVFGCYRYCRLAWGRRGPTLTCVAEGLVVADDLALRDPDGCAVIDRYRRTHRPSVGPAVPDRARRLRLSTRAEFCKEILLPALEAGATVVGFNLGFDGSRLAVAVADEPARAKGFEGGFSLPLLDYEQDGKRRENRYRPRLLISSLDSKRAKLGLTRPRPGSGPDTQARGRGSFLDLKTVGDSLAGGLHSLETACQAFGIDYHKPEVEHGTITPAYLRYCFEDVAASAALYQQVAREYERWGLALSPTRVYSGAGLARGYLREAGVRPLLERQPDFPAEVLGYSMVAYHGGRVEVRVRRMPVPVVPVDFGAAYATVASLLGLSRFLTCRRIDVVEEDPAEVERWLAGLTLDDCFRPQLWPTLYGLALVQPDGDILPARARYTLGGSYGTGVNPLTSEEPVWFTLLDVVAARLLGKAPRLVRVLRFRPVGTASGLRPFRIHGSRTIDPAREDVFRGLVEERRRFEAVGDPESLRTAAALKTVASCASYGVFVQLDRQQPKAEPVPVSVWGLDSFSSEVSAVEQPGEYFLPPVACFATAGARLLLAMLERLLTDVGGTCAFADTDAMAIVASRHGGLVPCPGGHEQDELGLQSTRAFTWAQVHEIIARFAALNPYDPAVASGSILELEPENFDPETGERRQLYCYAISAKRYCLFTLDERGEPHLAKWSEHALGGFYLNPTDPDSDDRDWVRQAWEWMLRDALGLNAPEPAWLDRLVLTRFTASNPRLLQTFKAWNDGRPYAEQVKPFNFLLVAHVAPGGHSAGADPKRFCLIAPYEPDPAKWERLAWWNVHDPASGHYRISTESIYDRAGHALPPGVVGVKTYRDVLHAYRVHPEPKSLGTDGRPCSRATIGLLNRRPVHTLEITHIGKEANLLDEIQAGLIGDEHEVLTEYRAVNDDTWLSIELPALQRVPALRLIAISGVPGRTVQYARAGRRPRAQHLTALRNAAASIAREELAAQGIQAPRDDLHCLRRWLRGQT